MRKSCQSSSCLGKTSFNSCSKTVTPIIIRKSIIREEAWRHKFLNGREPLTDGQVVPAHPFPKPPVRISTTLVIPLDKNVVRRILASPYHPDQTDGPSGPTVLGHMKDALWNMDSSGVNTCHPNRKAPQPPADLFHFVWQSYCQGLFRALRAA